MKGFYRKRLSRHASAACTFWIICLQQSTRRALNYQHTRRKLKLCILNLLKSATLLDRAVRKLMKLSTRQVLNWISNRMVLSTSVRATRKQLKKRVRSEEHTSEL